MSGQPLVVVGDTLLDVDLDATVDRLCPDAPVPVADVRAERMRPGGAGLAAILAARSGHAVVLVTALGDDEAAYRLAAMLEREVEVVRLPLRGSTPCKTRVRSKGRLLVRLDAGGGVAGAYPLTSPAVTALRRADTVVVADYGGGLTRNDSLRRELRRLSCQVPVVWDPHPRGPAPVPDLTLLTPNAHEAGIFAAGSLATSVSDSPRSRAPCPPPQPGLTPPSSATGNGAGDDRCRTAAALRRLWRSEAVAVTMGAAGAAFAGPNGQSHAGVSRIPPPGAVRVPAAADSCGAGDSFAVAAAGALTRGACLWDAARTAVEEATRFVAAGGASALSVTGPWPPALVRAQQPSNAFDLADSVRRRGGRLVAAGGCFDLLHPGHVALLRQARTLGDALVVCLNSDESVRRRKGPDRPVRTEAERAQMLAALECVDAVAVFGEDTPALLLDRLRPAVWVKGSDYDDTTMPEAETVRRYGGEVVLVPRVAGHSTTRLVPDAGRAP